MGVPRWLRWKTNKLTNKQINKQTNKHFYILNISAKNMEIWISNLLLVFIWLPLPQIKRGNLFRPAHYRDILHQEGIMKNTLSLHWLFSFCFSCNNVVATKSHYKRTSWKRHYHFIGFIFSFYFSRANVVATMSSCRRTSWKRRPTEWNIPLLCSCINVNILSPFLLHVRNVCPDNMWLNINYTYTKPVKLQ